mmetsp:Transcript_20359/g.30369  ORF Transcript_20359/g.30369 Transcript_20359/m.30369 type:complete len:476 (+) Transcript_20359:3079-4506(+)
MGVKERGASKQLGEGADFSEVRLSMPDEFFIESAVRGPAYARIRAAKNGRRGVSSSTACPGSGELDSLTRKDVDFIDEIELIHHASVKGVIKDTTPPHIGPKSQITDYRNVDFIIDEGSSTCNETVKEQLARQFICADFPSGSVAARDRNEMKLSRVQESASMFQDVKSNDLRRKQALKLFRGQINAISCNENTSKKASIFVRKASTRFQSIVGLPLSKLRRRFSVLQRSLNSTQSMDAATAKALEVAFLDAIDEGNIKVVRQLALQGVTFTERRYGKTPFQLAFIRSCRIDAGLEPSEIIDPLSCGLYSFPEALLDVLYETGHANIEQRIDNPEGTLQKWEAPIHVAARYGCSAKLKWLFDRNVKIDSRNSSRQTPLMLACRAGHLDAVGCLIEFGANINLVDEQDQTALHYAAMNDAKVTLELLIGCGANKRCKSKHDKLPVDICIEKGFSLSAEYLSRCALTPSQPVFSNCL